MLSPFHFFNLKFFMFNFLQFFYFLNNLFLKKNFFFLKNSMFSGMFFILLILNFTGMFPFFWTLSSYFWSNFLISFSFWILFLLYISCKNFNYFLSWFLPLNSPKMLWIFLIILEILSQMMRPLTLSLRLACNLITGHVLMSLLMNKEFFLLILTFILKFEMLISMIQASVFSMLLIMYKEETK